MSAGLACGGHPPIPARGVVEADLGTWKFRRFQEVLDVEVWVEGNKAEAYSASYITSDAEKRGRIDDKDLVNVFVTRYRVPDGVVRATVKLARRLAADGGYQVEEAKVAGARMLSIIGRGEAWMMWPSDKHVVKVGGRGRGDVPKAMIESYVDRYPSRLPGGALEGQLPPGPDDTPAVQPKPAYDPSSPQPDAEHYDPGKVKLPEHKDDTDAGAGAGSDAGAGSASEPPKPAKKKRRSK
ncbi:MAG TPA: hypothetical protein VGC42_31195 [Kofleriaceae bacterium]